MAPVQGGHFEADRTVAVTKAPIQRLGDPRVRTRETEKRRADDPGAAFCLIRRVCDLFSA
jgi:hypothetical protein